MSGPNVLILGGCGFVGRFLVKFLVENNLAGFIRACDKAMPATSNMSPAMEKLYDSPNVEYRQCNLTSPASIAKMFAEDKGQWNFVINLAAETKYGQPEAVYKERVLDLGVRCAQEAAKHKLDAYIDFSTGQVYEPGKKLRKEDGKIKPWTMLAKYSLQKEEEVKKLDSLPWIIVRPAIIYGPGDSNGLAPRLICGAVYKYLQEKMEFLWGGDVKMSTVHVRDVVKATWFLCKSGLSKKTFNLADHNDTDQAKVNTLLEQVFGIKTGFQNFIINSAARLSFTATAEAVNDKHLQPWMDLCKSQGINDTPLTPFIDAEVLYDNWLSVDGTAIEAAGFAYDHPKVDATLIKEQIQYFVDAGHFPKLT